MTTGLEDLQNIKDARDTAIINDELLRLGADIASIQETRLLDSGSLKEKTTPSSGRERAPRTIESMEWALHSGTPF